MNKTLKKTATAVLLTASIALSVPVAASAAAGAAGPAIAFNGVQVPNVDSYLTGSGQTYVNVASLAALVGIPYTLDAGAKTITFSGKTVPVELKNGMPYAHIRTLAAAAGISGVSWDKAANTVRITLDTSGKPAAAAGTLTVYGDTVQMGSCLVMNRFIPGDSIVFRMKAADPVTGKAEEGAKLQVHLSTGEVLDMQLGDHPPGAPGGERFWSVKYDVTDQTPKGTLNYYVTAQNGSKKGEYKPFNVMPSLLTIVSADQLAPASEAAIAEAPPTGGEA